MKLARPLMLLMALAACTPNSQTAAERRAEAARADSSAAGYEVAAGGTQATAPSGTHAVPADTTSHAATKPASQGGVVIPTPLVTVPHVATLPGHRPTVTVVDTTRGRRGGGGSPPRDPGASLPPMDPALEATFLVFDTLKKTAVFQLAAGNELGNQISLNGAQRGGRMLTVPVGWHVGIEFTNRDAELPHSATIVASFEPIPEQLPAPAFPNAQTDKVDEGLLEGDSDAISFVADRAGRYLIACGVLGHAQRGQWILLVVSPTATVPNYR